MVLVEFPAEMFNEAKGALIRAREADAAGKTFRCWHQVWICLITCQAALEAQVNLLGKFDKKDAMKGLPHKLKKLTGGKLDKNRPEWKTFEPITRDLRNWIIHFKSYSDKDGSIYNKFTVARAGQAIESTKKLFKALAKDSGSGLKAWVGEDYREID